MHTDWCALCKTMQSTLVSPHFPLAVSHQVQVYSSLTIVKDLGSAFPNITRGISQSPLWIHLWEHFPGLSPVVTSNTYALFPWLSDSSLIFRLIDHNFFRRTLSLLYFSAVNVVNQSSAEFSAQEPRTKRMLSPLDPLSCVSFISNRSEEIYI